MPNTGDDPGVPVDFVPSHPANLIAPLARQHEQPDNPAVVVMAACTPDFT
jgi:hypothetical protein